MSAVFGARGPGLSEPSLEAVLNNVQSYNAGEARRQQEATAEQQTGAKITQETDLATGQTTVKGEGFSGEDMQQIFQALQFTKQAMVGYQMEIDRLQKQEQEMSTGWGAIGNALATVGGNLAIADPRLPPTVRALGMASRQLNPTLNEIRDRKLAVMEQQSEMGMKAGALGSTIMQRENQLAMQQANLDEKELRRKEMERANKADEALALEKERRSKLDRLFYRASNAVKEGGDPLTKEAFTALAKMENIDALKEADLIEQGYAAHRDYARAIKSGKTFESGIEKDEAKYKAQLKRENDVHAYFLKKGLAADAKENAKDLATFKANLRGDQNLALVPKTNLDKLAGLHATEKYLNGVEDLLNNPTYEKFAGLSSVLMNKVPTWLKDKDRVYFESYLAHELPRILEIVGRGQSGGFSMLRVKEGMDTIRKLGVMKEMTPAQAKEVLGTLRRLVQEQRGGIAAETPRAPWQEYGALMGRDLEYVQGLLGGGMGGQHTTQGWQPNQPTGQPGAPATPGQITPTQPGGAFSDAAFEEWKRKRNASK